MLNKIDSLYVHSLQKMLERLWVIGSDPTRQPRYQPVEDCKYWPVLVSFNNWNSIQFTNKTTQKM